jgi:hypothetical protein
VTSGRAYNGDDSDISLTLTFSVEKCSLPYSL